MSITSQTNRTGPYVMASFPQSCPSGFAFQLSTDLVVVNVGQASAPHDPPITLTLGSDYTVSGGGYNSSNQMQTGTVLVATGGANNVIAGDVLWILRNVPVNQIASAVSANLTTAAIEQALDKQATISQQLTEEAGRSLRFEQGETLDGTLSLALRKGNTLGFDPTTGAPVFIPGLVPGGPQINPVSSIASLRSISTLTLVNNAIIQVLGCSSPGDGGGGLFYYNSSSSAADDSATIIAPSSGVGRWFRSYTGEINVRWFGAKGDGVTNDTTAIQSALSFMAASSLGGVLRFPAGTYITSATLNMVSENKYIRIVGDVFYPSQIQPNFSTSQPIFSVGTANYESDTISFENIKFGVITGAGATGTSSYCVTTFNRGGMYFSRCIFAGGYGGVNLSAKGWASHFDNCQFNGHPNNAIVTNGSDRSANGLVITKCYFFQAGLTNSVAALAINGGDGITIAGCDFEGVYRNADFAGCTGMSFSFNYCDTASNKHFAFSGTNTAHTFLSNYLGVAPSTSFDSIAGLSFENNSLYNASFTFPTTSSNIRLGFNYLNGTSALDTPQNCVVGTTPSQYIIDSTASAKSLRIWVASNYAQFLEKLDTSGSCVAIDLINHRLGVGTLPLAKLDVAGDLAISDTKLLKTNTSFTNGAGASTGTLTNAPSAGNPTKWIPVNDNGTVRYIPAW